MNPEAPVLRRQLAWLSASESAVVCPFLKRCDVRHL